MSRDQHTEHFERAAEEVFAEKLPPGEQGRLLKDFRMHNTGLNAIGLPEPIFREAIRWVKSGELSRHYGSMLTIAYSLRQLLDRPREHQPQLTGQQLYERACAGETRWEELGDGLQRAWARAERVLHDGLSAVVLDKLRPDAEDC
jgi:hypothetical protein